MKKLKGFGKIALMFGLLGGLMACLIIPVQLSRKRNLSPTEKAEYALTVDYYRSYCGAVTEEIEKRTKVYAQESREDIWAGLDSMEQHSRPPIGSPTWCHYKRALWFK